MSNSIDDKKTLSLLVRLSPSERKKFEARAKKRGLKVTQWLRLLGHEDCSK